MLKNEGSIKKILIDLEEHVLNVPQALVDIKSILIEKLKEKRGNRLYMGIEEVIELVEKLE